MPSCGKWWRGQQATGKLTPGYLAGYQTVLPPSSTTPQNRLAYQVLSQQWEQSPQNTKRTAIRQQQGARTLCFFMGYKSRAKEKVPYWEQELAVPLHWDGKSKALEPTPGQTEIVSKVFLNQRKKRSGSACGHWEKRWQMPNTVNSMTF